MRSVATNTCPWAMTGVEYLPASASASGSLRQINARVSPSNA
jgi:hypothetical protein